MLLLIALCPCCGHERRPCPSAAVSSTLGKHRELSPGWILPISRSALLSVPPDHGMHSNTDHPPPEKRPQNAPLCRGATVFLLDLLWEFSSPGPGCSSLTGAWHRALGWLRHGRRPQPPSPCSPSVPQPWPTAQEGHREAGRSHNVLEWDGDVQSEGFLQGRRGTCSSSWCCAVQGEVS